MSPQLVLSTFPGLDLLGHAFEIEGFCVVQGPDLKWGRDVRGWRVPRGRFDGVIGGPPCQTHSTMKYLALAGNGIPAGTDHGDQIPEFARIVEEAQPEWFVMENVPLAPSPVTPNYVVSSQLLDNRWLGEEQRRRRKFWFGYRDRSLVGRARVSAFSVEQVALEASHVEYTVLAGHGPAMGQRKRGIKGRSWQERAKLQGIAPEWIERMASDSPYTVTGLCSLIGNGVPLPMGRAVARAVKRALGIEAVA